MTERVLTLAKPSDLARCQPRGSRAVVTCEIMEQKGGNWQWSPRTYEFSRRAALGHMQWRIDSDGCFVSNRITWDDVVDWFCRMCPRNIEVLTTD